MLDKYEKMTNEELDELTVKRFGIPYQFYTTDDGIQQKKKNISVDLNLDGRYESGWNPSSADSNQCERHLFPKFDDDIIIICQHNCGINSDEFNAFIQKNPPIIEEHPEINDVHYGDAIDLADISTKDPGQINRTKVIACLMSWEKLNA